MVNWLETKGNKPCLPAPIWGSGCSIGKSSCTDPFYSQPALPMEHDWLLLLLYHLRIVRLRMLNHRAWAKNLFLLLVDSVKLSLAVGLRSNTALRCSQLLLIACLILATSKSFGISQLLRSRGHHTAITSLGLGVLTCFVHHHFITCFVDIKILIWFSILTGFSFVVVIRCK